jgi:preprotein translocase subunit SecD
MQSAVSRALLFVLAFTGLVFAASMPSRAESIDKTTNEMVVIIELTPDGKTAFENFTQRHVGRSMEIRIGTTLLLKARLVEKIAGGIIRANTKFNEDEAKKVSAQLTRGTMITVVDADT